MQNISRYTKESELIEGCKRGDRRAQQRLYESLAPCMMVVCMRYMRSREDAEDVLQEGFVKLFEKIGTYKGDGSFTGWARKIFVTTSLMELRKNDVMKFSDELSSADVLGVAQCGTIDQLNASELMKLIEMMPIGFRTVFNLYSIDGFSHDEIAKMLKISVGGSRSQLSRARLWLQEKIKMEDNNKK